MKKVSSGEVSVEIYQQDDAYRIICTNARVPFQFEIKRSKIIVTTLMI